MNSRISLLTLLAIVFLQTNCARSQEKQTRDVGEFSEIELGLPADLFLKQGQKNEVVIEADPEDLEDIETRISRDRLSIKFERSFYWSRGGRNIKVYVTMKDIKGLAVSGSGSITAEGIINTEDLYINISGSGELKGNFEAVRIDSKISGSGEIELEGSSSDHEVSISGSGDLRAEDMEVKNYDIRITGSGGCAINVSEELYVRISGSGKVRYRGNPERLDVSSSGSGTVRKF
jgi:hypothetical protein